MASFTVSSVMLVIFVTGGAKAKFKRNNSANYSHSHYKQPATCLALFYFRYFKTDASQIEVTLILENKRTDGEF